MLPKWSTPHRVVSRLLNSYTLETLNGELLPGSFSARRLQRFFPKEGTKLADEQKRREEQNAEEEREEAVDQTDNPLGETNPGTGPGG